MATPSPRRELAFLLNDVAHLLRTLADQRARTFDMTRAQWAVLSRLERAEGIKQSELAESLEIKPITLSRLVDRLSAHGLVERRPDPTDRRAKRLYLLPAARPLMDRLGHLGEELMAEALDGIDPSGVADMLKHLGRTKDNLRNALPASP